MKSFRQISHNQTTVDNLAHILPTNPSIYSDFTNKLITSYPPNLWTKERLFQTLLFGRLEIQQNHLQLYAYSFHYMMHY